MNGDQAAWLADALEYCGEDFSIDEHYSGRGMNGRETIAIGCDSLSLLVLCVMKYVRGGYEIDPDMKLDYLAEDSLGRGVVIY